MAEVAAAVRMEGEQDRGGLHTAHSDSREARGERQLPQTNPRGADEGDRLHTEPLNQPAAPLMSAVPDGKGRRRVGTGVLSYSSCWLTVVGEKVTETGT